jgi:FkbM family methyltransferase
MIYSIKNYILIGYRCSRVYLKRIMGVEPSIRVTFKSLLEYHGNKGYGGWSIPKNIITSESVVVDVGLGEDISFSESLILKCGCNVHGFDPTPKAIAYINKRENSKFQLHKLGLAGSCRSAVFYLPVNSNHVSGSLTKSTHIGNEKIEVQLIDTGGIFKLIKKDKIDLLKIDIEGAEYEVLNSESFRENAHRIKKFYVLNFTIVGMNLVLIQQLLQWKF